MSERIDIYDELMRPLGTKSRSEVHQEGHWHKAFHCWLVSVGKTGGADDGLLLFQRRSASKDIGGNTLDISAAGHLEAGEKPLDGLRELDEELGVRVESEKLKFLGVYVEVYRDPKIVNREFDYVYLLREDKELGDYRVEPEEVTGLTQVRLADGIALFSEGVAEIECESVVFDDKGRPNGAPFKERVGIDAFLGGKRNNYFIKMFLLARGFLSGEEHLFI